jgi:outer membrane lipoprotein carrier protein
MELLMALGVTAMVGSVVASPAPGSAAEELLRRVEARQHAASGLTARFVQTYKSGLLGREVVESGNVSVKAPGRMLWEYKQPEKKTFVSDGRTFYFYVPADRQVIVRDQAGEKGVAALLLSGGEVSRGFAVELQPAAAGFQRLRLTPRQADPEVQEVLLDVDEGARIRAIEVRDAQGNRSLFRFESIREGVKLPDRLFRFEIPRGVEVIAG